jgi:hypothetical protein
MAMRYYERRRQKSTTMACVVERNAAATIGDEPEVDVMGDVATLFTL